MNGTATAASVIVDAPEPTGGDALTGTVILGKYRVLREIGKGGMGAIHEAENLWTGRRVALKAMHAWVSRDVDHGRRFLREARTAGALDHPNIVVVHDLLRDPAEAMLYMVLEHLAGEDLFDRLRGGRAFTPREALEVLLPVMHALAAAHATGVIHRDVKPENIFLARTPGGITPKLLDFGVARFLHHNAERITDPGRILGTVEYMSPEHHAGREDLDGRTDVWSVGVVLYELLAGMNPFHRDSAVESYAAIMHGPPVDLRDHRADLSDALVALVNRALARDRDARQPSMRDLLDEALRCPELTHDRDSAHTPACRALRLTAREPTSERTLVWEPAEGPRIGEAALALRVAPPANDVVVLPRDTPANEVSPPGGLARGLLIAVGALALLLAAALLLAPRSAPARPAAPSPRAAPYPRAAPCLLRSPRRRARPRRRRPPPRSPRSPRSRQPRRGGLPRSFALQRVSTHGASPATPAVGSGSCRCAPPERKPAAGRRAAPTAAGPRAARGLRPTHITPTIPCARGASQGPSRAMAYPLHRTIPLCLLTLALGACGSTAVTAPTDAAAPADVGAVTDAPVTPDVPQTPDVPAVVDAPAPARDVVATDTVEPPLVVTGCDALQAGTVSNFMVDGVARSFILTLPTGATGPGGRWPVVFAWHGAGDNATNFNRLLSGQVNNSAMPFILVTPVSRRLVPPAGLEWEQLQARGPNGDARLFDAVLRCVGERYGLDEDRVYTGGFSAGAIMSDLLGVLRGDRLAAIAAFSGGYFANPENPPTLGAARGFVGWPEPTTTNRYPQLIAFGGERDFISLVVAQARFDQYAANDVPWLNAAGHDVIVCDHGGGHTVPSALLGATLVNFFQSHPRGTRRSPWGMTPPSNLPSYCRYSRGAGD